MTGEGSSLQEVSVRQETHLRGSTKTITQGKYESEYLTLQTSTVTNQFKVVETYIARVINQLNSTLLESILTEKIRINLLYRALVQCLMGFQEQPDLLVTLVRFNLIGWIRTLSSEAGGQEPSQVEVVNWTVEVAQTVEATDIKPQ